MSFYPQDPNQYFTPKNTFELNAPGLQHDPHWYRKAVFYEVLVRAFADANGDGSGDFHGLIAKLDYLQWLGCGLPLAAAVLPFPVARWWLRHRGLHVRVGRIRHHQRLQAAGGRGTCQGRPGHHRPPAEPHLRPAPVVPGVA